MSNAYTAGYAIGYMLAMLMNIAFIGIAIALAIAGVNSKKNYVKVLSWIEIIITIIYIFLLFVGLAAR